MIKPDLNNETLQKLVAAHQRTHDLSIMLIVLFFIGIVLGFIGGLKLTQKLEENSKIEECSNQTK